MMKKFKAYVYIILLVLITGLYAGDTFRDIFAEGVTLYKNKEYKKAADKFELIISQGKSNGEIYYNLGNCYYRLGEIGKAVLYYEKAKAYAGNDSDIEYNLEITRSKIKNPILAPPKLFFIKWWENLMEIMPESVPGYGMLITAFLLLAVSFAVVRFKNREWAVLLVRTQKTVAVIMIILTLLMVFKIRYVRKNKYAIVTEAKSVLKSEPFDESKELIFLPEGTKVRIIRNSADFTEVQLPDGNKGWIAQKSIGII